MAINSNPMRILVKSTFSEISANIVYLPIVYLPNSLPTPLKGTEFRRSRRETPLHALDH